MKQISIVLFTVMFSIYVNAQKVVEWVSSSSDAQWTVQKVLKTQVATAKFDAEIKLDKPLQTIDGFGTCFNELGWDALQLLSKKDRNSIFEELFKSGKGANFTICRMPIGANDFVKSWYSYNEIEGDFEMKNFTIDHDLKTINLKEPFILEGLVAGSPDKYIYKLKTPKDYMYVMKECYLDNPNIKLHS